MDRGNHKCVKLMNTRTGMIMKGSALGELVLDGASFKGSGNGEWGGALVNQHLWMADPKALTPRRVLMIV